MNAALLVSYDGTHFCGWQIQKNGISVQGELERAIFEAFGFRVRVTGSGRTDAGVHAAGQVCNFPLDDGIRILPGRIADALNVFLPPAVRVLESAAAPDLFDACRSAKRKTYRYALYFSEREKPLLERYAARVAKKPDLGKMRACAELLEGEHDFSSFSSTGNRVPPRLFVLFLDGFVRENFRAHGVFRRAFRSRRRRSHRRVRERVSL